MKRIPGTLPSTPGYRCEPGEDVFAAARRLYGRAASVDTFGTMDRDHPGWEFLGTVTVRPHETYPVYRIPREVNSSLYDE